METCLRPERLRFRRAVESDLPAVARLVNSAYRGESSRSGWTTEADLLGGQRTDAVKLAQLLVSDARGNGQQIELGFATDTLVACMSLRHEKPSTTYIGMVTVDPTQQTAGYGKQLLGRAEELAQSWHCTRIRMTVIHLRHELLAYYERRGYQKTGAIEPFPSEDPGFGIPKVGDMSLLELAKQL